MSIENMVGASQVGQRVRREALVDNPAERRQEQEARTEVCVSVDNLYKSIIDSRPEPDAATTTDGTSWYIDGGAIAIETSDSLSIYSDNESVPMVVFRTNAKGTYSNSKNGISRPVNYAYVEVYLEKDDVIHKVGFDFQSEGAEVIEYDGNEEIRPQDRITSGAADFSQLFESMNSILFRKDVLQTQNGDISLKSDKLNLDKYRNWISKRKPDERKSVTQFISQLRQQSRVDLITRKEFLTRTVAMLGASAIATGAGMAATSVYSYEQGANTGNHEAYRDSLRMPERAEEIIAHEGITNFVGMYRQYSDLRNLLGDYGALLINPVISLVPRWATYIGNIVQDPESHTSDEYLLTEMRDNWVVATDSRGKESKKFIPSTEDVDSVLDAVNFDTLGVGEDPEEVREQVRRVCRVFPQIAFLIGNGLKLVNETEVEEKERLGQHSIKNGIEFITSLASNGGVPVLLHEAWHGADGDLERYKPVITQEAFIAVQEQKMRSAHTLLDAWLSLSTQELLDSEYTSIFSFHWDEFNNLITEDQIETEYRRLRAYFELEDFDIDANDYPPHVRLNAIMQHIVKQSRYIMQSARGNGQITPEQERFLVKYNGDGLSDTLITHVLHILDEPSELCDPTGLFAINRWPMPVLNQLRNVDEVRINLLSTFSPGSWSESEIKGALEPVGYTPMTELEHNIEFVDRNSKYFEDIAGALTWLEFTLPGEIPQYVKIQELSYKDKRWLILHDSTGINVIENPFEDIVLNELKVPSVNIDETWEPIPLRFNDDITLVYDRKYNNTKLTWVNKDGTHLQVKSGYATTETDPLQPFRTTSPFLLNSSNEVVPYLIRNAGIFGLPKEIADSDRLLEYQVLNLTMSVASHFDDREFSHFVGLKHLDGSIFPLENIGPESEDLSEMTIVASEVRSNTLTLSSPTGESFTVRLDEQSFRELIEQGSADSIYSIHSSVSVVSVEGYDRAYIQSVHLQHNGKFIPILEGSRVP